MAKLVQLTTNSWLLRAGVTSSGILFKLEAGDYLFMSPTLKSSYATLEDVSKKFGKLEKEERKSDEQISTIRAYPVKHDGIAVVSEEPPLYTKGGAMVFAAGYWGLKFTNGWTQAYCPKYETCQKYESVGPFTTRLEMLNHLSMLNTQDNLKKAT